MPLKSRNDGKRMPVTWRVLSICPCMQEATCAALMYLSSEAPDEAFDDEGLDGFLQLLETAGDVG